MAALLLLAASLLAGAQSPPPHQRPSPEGSPVEVFADLDGVWEGEFAGYDTEGREVYRITVRQSYHTLDATTQHVEIADTMPDGTVVTGTGRNTAERLADGSLKLRCVVVKSNGERVSHQGRLGRAPDGGEQLVWSSSGPDRWESFRETVRREGGEWIYRIDGAGRYGDTFMIMAGRYRRIGGPRPDRPAAP